MVNEAKVLKREELRSWRRIDVKIGKGKVSSLLPAFNICLDFRSPQQICSLWGCGTLFLHGHIHVGTATVMLGTVTAKRESIAFLNFLDRRSADEPRRSHTIEESSHHNVYVYACRSHSLYGIWCDYVRSVTGT